MDGGGERRRGRSFVARGRSICSILQVLLTSLSVMIFPAPGLRARRPRSATATVCNHRSRIRGDEYGKAEDFTDGDNFPCTRDHALHAAAVATQSC